MPNGQVVARQKLQITNLQDFKTMVDPVNVLLVVVLLLLWMRD